MHGVNIAHRVNSPPNPLSFSNGGGGIGGEKNKKQKEKLQLTLFPRSEERVAQRSVGGVSQPSMPAQNI